MIKLNMMDRAIAAMAPGWGLRRAQARQVLAYYEAARPDRLRKGRRATGSGNTEILRAGTSLRQQARHFEQNYDLALGALNAMVANVIGKDGIGIEPQPKMADGQIHDEFSGQLLALYKDWSKRPEVTWLHDWPSAQRLLARTWFRDGEVFAQTVEGLVPYLDHGTKVPLSIEMLEPDYCPMEYQSLSVGSGNSINQGVEINTWGRPMAYYLFKQNPLEYGGLVQAGQLKRLTADRCLHLATRHRIRQLRGVSVFASVMGRFDDLKDYEESERIAAKVAASMAAYIKKGQPDMYASPEDGQQRDMKFRPGMIFDDLMPGEEIGMIDSKRPNPNLETYRSGQLKAVAAGMGPSYSTLARTYDGTYSAQRQELVEGWSTYAILSDEFTSRIVRPVYEKFVALAVASGQIKVPQGIKRETLNDALYVAPQMPWIDPEREANGWATLEDRCYISGPEVVRKRGGNPMETLDQQARWRREKEARDLPDAPGAATAPAAVPEPMPMQDAKPAEPVAPDTSAALLQVVASNRETSEKLMAMASREQAAPVITINQAPVTVENHLPESVVNVAAPNVTVEAPEVTVQNLVPEQAAPVVNVAAPNVTVNNDVMPAAISQIEIVSMPDRATTTSVERDGRGDIVKSTQTERDA